MMKKMILTVAAAAAVAVSAKGQTFYAQAGEIVAISSLVDANAQGGVTYEWYRNGVRIPGCNEATCAIPASMATGTDVKFYRRAIALGCAIGNTSNTNAITITFCNVVQDGVCWGDVNVDEWRTFASKPDVHTTFFQFNRTKAWPADGNVTDWVTTPPESGSWHVDSSPCPDGWRLPTRNEAAALINNSNPVGGTWTGANGRGSSLSGRFFGIRSAECSLPDDMVGCAFFASSGNRNESTAVLGSRGAIGYFWTSTENGTTNAWCLYATNGTNTTTSLYSKERGLTVRCVRGGEE